ncbi:MAG TPA: cupin domain-containing protein [Rubricoccaceae bacterium]|jgi:quercetin dioxygenase-like cupin family protein|nr:cupin domain-containing protein [Rubricoccaceae bacterium]
MITAKLSTQDRPEVWWDSDPAVRVRADFPLSARTGAEHSAVVYFELEPGRALGRHTDSAEEVLLVLDGTVEVTVGEERAEVAAGGLALVPEMVPHNVRNVGEGVARVAGFFPSGHVRAEFDQPFAPAGQRVFEF